MHVSEMQVLMTWFNAWMVILSLNGEPQEAYSLGGARGEEVVYIVH